MFFIYFDNSTDHTDRILIFQIEFCWKRFFIIVMLEICRKMNTTFGPKHMIFRVVIRQIENRITAFANTLFTQDFTQNTPERNT